MNMRHPFLPRLLFLLGFTSAVQAYPQRLPTGPQVLTFHSVADDTEQPYSLYLPKSYDENKAYPLVVMLHGAGSNHRLALRRVFGKSNANGETDVEASRYFPEWTDVEYIVVAPYARGTAGYQGIVEQDVYAVLDDVKKRFKIDEDRVYLTGLSMGGGGTLWIGLTRPDIWAALAPVCPAPPAGTSDLLGNAQHLPVHFFHGDADPVVPIAGTRQMVDKMQQLGIQVQSEEYEGVKHDSWVNAYEGGQIFKWFAQYKRNPHPDKVHFSTHTLKHNKAYWVELLQLDTGGLAHIEAEITGRQQLNVKTEKVVSFHLNLKEHPQISMDEVISIEIDGRSLRLAPESDISFYKDGNTWKVGNLIQPGSLVKQPSQSGPIYEAFSDRHVYVYGTADNPSGEELAKRRVLAYEAANWSAYRGEFLGRMMFFPRILADNEVRPSDLESSHLVLFGNKENNALIKNMADDLPIHLDASDAEHGLFYIFPHNERYVVVNSGKPWWGINRRTGFSFTTEVHQALPSFKDFVLYRDGADGILIEGYFDNNWQIPLDKVRDFRDISTIEVK